MNRKKNEILDIIGKVLLVLGIGAGVILALVGLKTVTISIWLSHLIF